MYESVLKRSVTELKVCSGTVLRKDHSQPDILKGKKKVYKNELDSVLKRISIRRLAMKIRLFGHSLNLGVLRK